MNGLDAILQRIVSDAQETAAGIESSSAAALEALSIRTAEAAEHIRIEMRRQSDAEIAALERRTASTIALETRRIRLAARQRLVADAIEGAVARLAGLPSRQRAQLYLDQLDEAARGGETVLFAADDLADGTARTVLDEANRRLASRNPAAVPLTMSAAPGSTRNGGGIVLSLNDIEDNLTYDKIVRQHREELESLAAALVLDEGRDDGR